MRNTFLKINKNNILLKSTCLCQNFSVPLSSLQLTTLTQRPYMKKPTYKCTSVIKITSHPVSASSPNLLQ